ncbi:hypothetical protein [Methylorubrum extorquens]|jgi:hypothetical protein|uniref:Uncharacterized protein n=1 Tax=Methylorubrum extorquens (strain DSM 6343 / CIP 106787 / DM4) TaxID=661410 RepID=C7CFC8_METED|nr:hypothetical protein [Methylorubrum extorquens]UYW30361.1 hypothetical protein OKB92_15250 [Methylorubrum extorquens]CAX26062.1 protein of unknown function [Methylorubrum extorquens DM4]
MHAESLDALGRHLYGPRYVTSLAEALSEYTPKPVQAPHVSMWAKGQRSIPDFVGPAAFRVAERGYRELMARAEAVNRMLYAPFEHGMPSLPPAED